MSRKVSPLHLHRKNEKSRSENSYAVTCRCGWTSRGRRTETWQDIECDGCGARKFVLPINVYPPVDISWQNHDAPVSSSGNAAKSKNAVQGIDISSQSSRRILTPKRLLVLVGMIAVAVITGTAYWQVRRSRIQAAENEFKTHSDAGLAYVHSGEYAKAIPELKRAVAALEILERDDQKARKVRQMLRESIAISDLAPELLVKMLTDFEQQASTGNADWEEEFRRRFANQWIVMETTLSRNSDGDVVVDFPLMVGNAPVRIQGKRSAFQDISQANQSRPYFIALQLKSCRRIGGASPAWEIGFNPDSAFLWTNYKNLRALGFDVAGQDGEDISNEAEIRQRLKIQAKLMGLSE
ncbi:MAG: hypothetical protein Tsb009_21540 [Planctomycetaceae bacterium]